MAPGTQLLPLEMIASCSRRGGGSECQVQRDCCPLLSAYPSQLNVQIPYVLAGVTSASVQVTAFQINMIAPEASPVGSAVPVTVMIGGIQSNLVTMAVTCS
jgi:hypothetical protein